MKTKLCLLIDWNSCLHCMRPVLRTTWSSACYFVSLGTVFQTISSLWAELITVSKWLRKSVMYLMVTEGVYVNWPFGPASNVYTVSPTSGVFDKCSLSYHPPSPPPTIKPWRENLEILNALHRTRYLKHVTYRILLPGIPALLQYVILVLPVTSLSHWRHGFR